MIFAKDLALKMFNLEQWFPSIDKVKGDCMNKSMGQVLEAGPQASADFFIGMVTIFFY